MQASCEGVLPGIGGSVRTADLARAACASMSSMWKETAALAVLVAPLASQATLRVEGLVRDALCHPVPIAEVWAEVGRPGARKVVAKGRCDGQGMFVLSLDRAALPAGTRSVTVKATAPGKTLDYGRASLSRPGFVRLRLWDAVPVTGLVVDASGAPVPDAVVFANYDIAHLSGIEPSSVDRSDAAGAFELARVPVGWATVRAWHPSIGYFETRLRTDEAKRGVALVLAANGTVDLHVAVPGGEAVDDVQVSMLPYASHGLLAFPVPMRLADVRDGVATFANMPPSIEYVFEVRSRGSKRWEPSQQKVERKQLADAGDVFRVAFERGKDRKRVTPAPAAAAPVPAKGQLSGRLLDESGNAVAGMLLTLQTQRPNGSWRAGLPRCTDWAGAFVFPRVDAKKSVRIAIGWGSKMPVCEPFELDPGQVRKGLELVAPKRGTVAGCIVDDDGKPVGGARVTLFAWNVASNTQADGGDTWDTITDRNGRYRIPDLAPGGYFLTTRKGEAFAVLGTSVPFELRAGESFEPEVR